MLDDASNPNPVSAERTPEAFTETVMLARGTQGPLVCILAGPRSTEKVAVVIVAGQPQTRPAEQQPSPYTPPRPGAQGTVQYRPQGTPPQSGPSPYTPPPQGTATYRPQSFPPQGGQPGMVPPAQGTATYRPQSLPPQGGQPGMVPPAQGTATYRPQSLPPQGGQPGAAQSNNGGSTPGDSQARTEQTRRRRSDRHSKT